MNEKIKKQEETDEYAEVPEEVLSEDELAELEEVKKELSEKKKRNPYEKEEAEWIPKTELGKQVKQGEIDNIDEILDSNKKILEPEIVDTLIELESDLIPIGQSKGKFGGGKRRAWRQTQRKTKEGNVPTFSAMAVIGDCKGHVGIGSGRASETLPARDKAIRKAKLNIIKVKRDCSAFDCDCSKPHTIPFKVEGKCGSVKVVLVPAPQGIGLAAGDNLKPILKLAGIEDIYTKTFGHKKTTFNLVKACIKALEKTNQ